MRVSDFFFHLASDCMPILVDLDTAMHSSSMAIMMMAVSRLKMPADHVIWLDLIESPFALLLTTTLPYIQKSFRISNSRITAWAQMCFSIIPIWGSLGLAKSSWGIDSEPKVWIVAVLLAAVSTVFLHSPSFLLAIPEY